VTNFQTSFPDSSNSKVGWLEKSGRIWRATQNVVEFFERDTGYSLYSWEYKASKSATIWSVHECETTHEKICYLIAIQLAGSSLVCLLEFNRVIKMIEVPMKVTSLCFFNNPSAMAYSALSSFRGIIVLGCHGGDVLTMDLQLDVGMSKSIDVCKKYSPIREISSRDSPKVARQQLLKDGIHVFFNLNSKELLRVTKLMD